MKAGTILHPCIGSFGLTRNIYDGNVGQGLIQERIPPYNDLIPGRNRIDLMRFSTRQELTRQKLKLFDFKGQISCKAKSRTALLQHLPDIPAGIKQKWCVMSAIDIKSLLAAGSRSTINMAAPTPLSHTSPTTKPW